MARRERLTIDELSHQTEVSSRNIRYYQTRGLLPAPTVKGRTGYYDERHVERLDLIAELQGEGLNLQAISWLLGGSGAVASDELRALKRSVLDSWVTDEPVEISVKNLRRQAGNDDEDFEALEERAIGLQLLERVDDDTYRVLLPGVLAAGAELANMGVGFDRALDVLEEMRGHASSIAASYVRIFDEAVVAPWDARGRPEGEFAAIGEAVDRLRPLAGEALLGVFRQVIGDVIADTLAETGLD